MIDNFLTFSSREVKVLKQFFDEWKLSETIRNIHNQPYVKNFKPKDGQIRLEKEEFKSFAEKLLYIVNFLDDK